MHYLPHHGVVCIHLNECLYKGPKFHQLILDPLIRFISYKVALIADVEKAFLMIAVNEKDCDVSDSFGWTMWLKKSLSYVCVQRNSLKLTVQVVPMQITIYIVSMCK